MNVGFIGFGNMAQALATGFLRGGALLPQQIGACARDWEKLKTNTEPHGFQPFRTAAELVAWADTVVVAVKPHQVVDVLTPLRKTLVQKVVVSVVAGYTYNRYEELLEPATHHLSTIPNTPVAVCEGVVVCEQQHSLSDAEYLNISALLAYVGLVLPVETEQLAIAGTICGCGPAFACLFIEALADAAVKHGIARAEAYRMVSQMVVGTGKMQLTTGLHPGVMKDAVCSPGGTTIVGVTELESKGLRAAVIAAVDAIQRGRE